MKKIAALVAGTCLLGAILSAQRPPADPSAASCTNLSSLQLSNATVTLSQVVRTGKFTPPRGREISDLPGFCRVALTIRPSSDSDIKAETWLPLSGWNGKFQEVGNGAWGGSIQYAAMAEGLKRGYAMASTDTGHTGTDASFAVGHPEKMIDFAYRSIHETALQSKAVIAALYHAAPRLSYFSGCSGGGRQAFSEVQRYPQDFDGVIAGAPGYDRTNQSFQLVAIAQATHKDKASWIPPEKYPVLHQAALNACDALDGVKDGLISEPMRCHFDPAVIQCKGADSASCLTAAQVEAARKIYAGVNDPKTGQQLFPGQEPGSEMRWGGTSGSPRPLGMSDDLFKYVVFGDPNWDFMSLDLRKDLEKARQVDKGELSPASPNIQPFVGRGGKLVIYHGWGDQNISPRSSVNYYEKLVTALGEQQVEDSVRLYMVPGMGHCGGGEGPDQFDMLSPLEHWREQSQAPAEVIASKITDGKVEFTRPLCPYPQVARYKGTGSTDLAENFVCRMP
jgi:Tannase and feruloyl esterase